MKSIELYNHEYVLDEIGINLYDKTKDTAILLIPYEKIEAINLHCEPPSRHNLFYKYSCTIYYKNDTEETVNLQIVGSYVRLRYYSQFVEGLHEILNKKHLSIRYTRGYGNLAYTFQVILTAPLIIVGFALMYVHFLFGLGLFLLSFFLVGKYIFISSPRTYSPLNIPPRLLPDTRKQQESFWEKIVNDILYLDIKLLFFLILLIPLLAMIGIGLFLILTFVVITVQDQFQDKTKIKKSLYNNTKSEIAAIYIDSSTNILESDLVLKPNQHTEVWVSVDYEKQRDKNSTVKLKFTDSTVFEMRMPICKSYNGCSYDICINDDGKIW